MFVLYGVVYIKVVYNDMVIVGMSVNVDVGNKTLLLLKVRI